MATVRFYRGHWVADYYDANKRRRIERPEGHFEKAKQELHAARVLLANRVAEVTDGLVHEGRGTFDDVANRWLASLVFGNKMETVANLPTQLERPSAGNLSKSA